MHGRLIDADRPGRQATLVKSGVVRVVELLEQGWTYVRPQRIDNVPSLDDYNSERRGGAILHRIVVRTILAEILKSVGIGWLFLVGMGTLAALSLAVANGGRVAAYPGLTIGLLASPGLVLLLAGLLLQGVRGSRQQGARTAEALGEHVAPRQDER